MKLFLDYYKRLESLTPDCLHHLAFLEQKELDLKWYQTIRTIKETYDYDNLQYPAINIRAKVEHQFKKMWEIFINASPKLKFYSSLKTSFGREAYIALSNKSARDSLTRLRMSAHTLEIERGRYKNTPREERLCKGCLVIGIKVIEDEQHLLSSCTMFSNLRADLPSSLKIQLSCPISLFKETKADHQTMSALSQLGKFICACLSQRKTSLQSIEDTTKNQQIN